MDAGTKGHAEHEAVLVVAYGNLSRRDDGVAFHIVRCLRERLGLPEPESAPGEAVDEDYVEWSDGLAVACMHQLAPEITELLAGRDIVVFVDAHVPEVGWEPVEWREVVPAYHSGMVSHHLKPDTVLALCRSVYGRCPRGYLLSVLGTDFDFGETLSPQTAGLLSEAVERLLAVVEIGASAAR